MITRNLAKVQEALDALNPVQRDINELKYFKNVLNSPNHSNSLCSSVCSMIDTLTQQHSEVVNALILYGTTYQEMDERLALLNDPEYQSTGTDFKFSYVSAPEHQKGFWEKTWNQIVLGDYSDDATWLGSTLGIVAAFFGVDAPMDARDFTANVSKGQWGWAVVSAVSLLPIIGVLGKGGKAVFKGAKAFDTAAEVIDATSPAIKQGSNLIDGGSTIFKQTDNIVPKAMVDNYFDDMIKHSEFPHTIVNDGSTWTKITSEQNDIMRTEFKKLKPKLISDWETANNLKWPMYDSDIFTDSGDRLRKAGNLYDAHHIKPLEFGGLNTFDNITPFHSKVHYDKQVIHAPTSPFGNMENLYK